MGKRRTASTGIAAEVAGRRAVLAGLGVVGAGTLAACSSSGSTASSTPSAGAATRGPAQTSAAPSAPAPSSATAAASATSTAPATSAAPVSSPPAAASTAAAPAGFSVAETDIPVGTGKYFSAAAAIITQPTAGSFRAFTSVCTHQGCPVTQSSGAVMICPCHGSEYSIKDGSVVRGPSTEPLAAKKVTVAGGKVFVAKT